MRKYLVQSCTYVTPFLVRVQKHISSDNDTLTTATERPYIRERGKCEEKLKNQDVRGKSVKGSFLANTST